MRQVMLRDKEQQYAFQHAHPFSSTMEELASTAYKYRKWQLTPDMALIARCEVDGTTALWAQHYHACRPIDSTGKSVALFYRSPRPSAVLVRSASGAAKGKDDSVQLLTIKALNEFDSKISGVDWRQKLDAQVATTFLPCARPTGCDAMPLMLDNRPTGVRVHAK